MLEKAMVLTTLFTIVDDVMKGSAMIQDALKRPGPAPRLTDSELVTIAIYQELIGEPREDHFFRLHQASLLTFFPGLNERSRYNRRKRDLWAVILAVRISLQIVLDALQCEETAAVDSAPVPCVGYKRSKANSDFAGTADYGVCSRKAMKYFGCKFHSVVSLTGVIMGFLVTQPVLMTTRSSRTCLAMAPSMMRPSRAFLSSIAVCSCSLQPGSTNPRNGPHRRKGSSIASV
ncbi:MAG: hypothetical protein ACJ8DI_18690 [Ktedonobacteraceae bacterium]